MKKILKFAFILIAVTTLSTISHAQPGCGNTNLGTLTPTTSTQYAAYNAGDSYYWDFSAISGDIYTFSSCGAGEDTRLRIYDASFVLIASNDDNGPHCGGTAASIDWTCAASGTYYVSLAHYSCSNLSNNGNFEYYYTVYVPTPDCGDTDLGTLIPTTSPQYATYSSGDTYFWDFSAASGNTYAFSSCGAGEDTKIRIYDASLVLIASNDDNGPYCGGNEASINWACQSSGTYYVSLAHYQCSNLSNSGNLEYFISVYVPKPDCGNTDLGTLTPTTSLQYAAYSSGDTYFWDFSANLGDTYVFNSCGAGEDTKIRIYDDSFTLVASADDNGPLCNGNEASINWICTLSGTYYVSLAHYQCSNLSNAGNFEYHKEVTATSWIGIIDNDWWNPGNWTNGLPSLITDVTIPAGAANFPTVGSVAQCNTLSMESGASLLDNGLLLANNGVTIERTYSGNQWHLISSPVTGPLSGMFTGLYLQGFDESSNLYGDIIPVDSTLTPGSGFALYNQNGNATASYNGSLTWSATTLLTRSAAGGNNGWNLVGNPYPSSIDWEAASGWTKTNIEASTYRFDGAGSGNWAIWNGITGTNGATQFIASGQGFFVAVNDDGSSIGTLEFTNEVRIHDNTAFYKEEPVDIVKLKVSGNDYSDETAVYFREGATVGFDSQLDAHNLSSFELTAPNIYSTANGGMAINVLPEVMSVPMTVKVGIESGTFTIEAVSNGGFSKLYLEDIATGIITDLNSDACTFDYIPGMENRFVLHFSALGLNDIAVDRFNIYSYDKDVYVAVPENSRGTITVYDMMGKEIAKKDIAASVNVIPLENSAYYVVKVLSNESIVTKKLIIK
jgi:hypothetical protein